MARRVAVQDFRYSPLANTITSPQNALLDVSTSGATATFWAYIYAYNNQSMLQFFTASTGDSFRINLESTGKLFTWHVKADGTGTIGAKMTSSVSALNKWVKIAFTYDGNGYSEIFINGVSVCSGNSFIVRPTAYVVAYPSSNNQGMCDLKIWNRKLSATEISDDYATTNVPSSPVLVWRMGEGSGVTSFDTSGNGLNGAIDGSTWTTNVPSRTRRVVQNFPAALDFSGVSTNNISVPYTFPTDAFSVEFRYKTKAHGGFNQGAGTASTLYPSESLFYQAGSLSLARQGTNDMQLYAYLNAPNDYAGLRRLRFRNFYMPNGDGKWHQRVYVIYVQNGSAKCDEYEDGAKILATPHTVDYTGDASTPSGNLAIGNNTSTYNFNGLLSDVRIFNRKLTDNEVMNLYTGATPVSGDGLHLPMTEGTGSTVADTSGNGNNGTITGATWSTDTPGKSRVVVATRRPVDNLIPNGDFENHPTPNGVLSASGAAWIDGTAGGSQTNSQYIWRNSTYTVQPPYGAMFDSTVAHVGTTSMKLTGIQIKERVNVQLTKRNYPDENNPVYIAQYQVRVQPLTEYTLSGFCKQISSNIVGNPQGASLQVYEHTFTGYNGGASTVAFGNGSFDFRRGSVTFTTKAGTYYLNVDFGLYCDGSNYYDATAWFDDLKLTPTTPNPRIAV